ncbi:YARHG domain-containing protein [Mariniflexile soesokkakense]|uniref:YARHG domain-containing protein n=1 Tax=Mariniflexile soesokkakense TaxID=1343160 RepID=A0ABV0A6M6_9FLAO
MKIKEILIGSTFILIPFLVTGQIIGFEKIDSKNVTSWNPKFTLEYQCVYHFGDSEMESNFILIFGLDKYYGQIKSGTWSEDGKSWIWTYENLSNIRIDKNKFYSDQTNGEFVIYDNGQEKIKGLKIYNSWSGLTENEEYEIGTKSYPIDDYYNGKFPQASKRILSIDELLKMTKRDLNIMRNEIFARYGYKFKSGGEMDNYFKNQDWYSGQNDNINDFLTELEKENIKLIQQIENE